MTSPTTLVWIDAREAVIARGQDREAHLERLLSDVPAHHRATGHVRHDPAFRHGGGGSPQSAGEPQRLEHLERFIAEVAGRLPPDEDIVILGPGTVREHLERRLQELDTKHGRGPRTVTSEASARLTDRQLVARLRAVEGVEPPRRTVGAYRWSAPVDQRHGGVLPRRVVDKPRRESQDET